MKKINFLAIIAIFSLLFSSCSSEENISLEPQNSQLLKSLQVKRDADGAYSLDLDVKENVKVEKVLNVDKNINEYFLYLDNENSKTTFNDDLVINDNRIKFGFVDTNSDKPKFITIEDDNITLAAKTKGVLFLKDYVLTTEEDGSVSLDFSVKSNTEVSFVYNSDLNAYEVHLEKGKSKKTATSFSRSFSKVDGETLQIHFVNHVSNKQAKGGSGLIRKPVIIIDDGEDA